MILWSLNHGFVWRQGLRLRRQGLGHWAMIVAHLGVGITALGIICTTAYSEQRDVSMRPGDSVQVGAYQFKFQSIADLTGPNYQGMQAKIAVYRGEKLLRILEPQQRYFPVTQTVTAKASIDAGLFRDLYVALGDSLPNGAWSFRIYDKPFIRWIWAGGVFMFFGGLLSILDRRYRNPL